jgi:hypothetical protein
MGRNRENIFRINILLPNGALGGAVAFVAISMAYPSAANRKVPIKPNGSFRFDTDRVTR